MFVVGLTGGIGTGKSTLAALLAERGAQVIDADQLGRDALEPGKPAWHSVVDTFGSEILSEGSIEVDRARLAEIVFNDPERLTALNQIVHPVILAGIAEALEKLRGGDSIVVLDAALIVEMGLRDLCDALIVVSAGDEARTERLLAQRSMSPEDVRARMRSQAAAGDLDAQADIVVANDGRPEDLSAEADRVWDELRRLAAR